MLSVTPAIHPQHSGKSDQCDGDQHGRKRRRTAGYDEDRRHEDEAKCKTEVMRCDNSRSL
jgi:hypothetical protein